VKKAALPASPPTEPSSTTGDRPHGSQSIRGIWRLNWNFSYSLLDSVDRGMIISGMRPPDFDDLYNLEERFWWFAAMRNITDAIVDPDMRGKTLHVLDAGCGTGYNIAHYEKKGHQVLSFDISEHALAGVVKRGFRKVCQASVTEIPYRSKAFDLVLSLDVLGQISIGHASQAIAEMRRVLRPGGALFIRVPAFERIRSSHDAELQVVHRYSRPELEAIVRNQELDIEVSSYANTLLLPVAILRRCLKRFGVGKGSDVKPLPLGLKWLDPVFRGILTAESKVLTKYTLPVGLSVLIYAKRREKTQGA
jgi:SAM-dependent methyltransferase